MRETRVLLLRHAQTSAPELFHGAESDVGLGDAGRQQAEQVATVLAAIRPDAIICSGMRRARETAEPLARACELQVQTVEALHERRMGPMSGQSRAEFHDAYQETETQWMAGEVDYSHAGGESYRQIQERVVPAFQALADQHEGQCVVVVAHGVVIRVLISSLVEGLSVRDFARIGIEHVAVNDLRLAQGRWTAHPFP